jgi:hypothetical protein
MTFQQLYENKPTKLRDVKGASSQTIYVFMKFGPEEVEIPIFPNDVDDWERNRALLICYPEWKERLRETSSLSNVWKDLVDNWDIIEEKYNKDYEKYNNMAYDEGECNKYIRKITKF